MALLKVLGNLIGWTAGVVQFHTTWSQNPVNGLFKDLAEFITTAENVIVSLKGNKLRSSHQHH